eukprot:1161568-Pelagomonas_calceolata.AAC.13
MGWGRMHAAWAAQRNSRNYQHARQMCKLVPGNVDDTHCYGYKEHVLPDELQASTQANNA